MENVVPLLLSIVVGFTHAFEADHLVAVSSIVTRRDKIQLAVKDGIFWGLGHSSTILLIGMLVLLGKAIIPEIVFNYLEAAVGLMLFALGTWRLASAYRNRNKEERIVTAGGHGLAYGVGLVHGLAGSGALIILVLANAGSNLYGVTYLLFFGFGSVVGMLVAAGILGLPFAQKALKNTLFRFVLSLCSSLLCIGYGAYVVIENIA